MAATPFPVRLTVCVLLGDALSLIVKVADRLPTWMGLKVTLIVQFAPAATEMPQVLVSLKSPPSAPLTLTLLMVSASVPVFESVMVWAGLTLPTAWLPKYRRPGERFAAAPAPVPVRLTDCVPPADALSLTVKIPERMPA